MKSSLSRPASAARRRGLVIALWFAATLVPAALNAAQAAAPDLRGRWQSVLDGFLAGGKFPGVTAGVVLPDGTSFGLTAGVSDLTSKTPLKPSDRMIMGSVGKTYVAAVALQLMAEGRLGLDDKIVKWFAGDGWFARLPNARDITVRHLMTHTSGLVRYEFNERFTADLTRQPDKTWRPEELVAYILDTPAPFPAGKGWDYSDTNYIVLGMILERTAKSAYYDLLRQRILVPLRLQDTVPTDSRTIPGLVQGYAGPQNPFGGSDAMIRDGKLVINPQFEWTGGGLACTAEDLARWGKLLYEGRAFDPAWLPKMLEGVPARLGPNTQYGLGVIIRPSTPLGRCYGHSGFFPGYMTEMMYFPDSGIAAAALVNTSVFQTLGKPLARVVLELAQAAAGKS